MPVSIEAARLPPMHAFKFNSQFVSPPGFPRATYPYLFERAGEVGVALAHERRAEVVLIVRVPPQSHHHLGRREVETRAERYTTQDG